MAEQDEHIRPNTTLESLALLQARFKTGGTVTAGNASALSGAAALVLAAETAAEAHELKPLGRVGGGQGISRLAEAFPER